MCSVKIVNRLIKLKHCKVLAESDLRAPLSVVLILLPAWLPRLKNLIATPLELGERGHGEAVRAMSWGFHGRYRDRRHLSAEGGGSWLCVMWLVCRRLE